LHNGKFKDRAVAVPALRQALRSDDLWLRIKAAEALAAIGQPALAAAPEMLNLLTRFDMQQDPRGMQQRFFALFDDRNGLLGHSLEGVDRPQLYQAVRAGLKNDDGRARSDLSSAFRNLSAEEIKPLFPDILQAVTVPAPSGEMFADGIRVEGLRVLAQHHVEEGMRACVDYIRTQNGWASEHRTPELTRYCWPTAPMPSPSFPNWRKSPTTLPTRRRIFPKTLASKRLRTCAKPSRKSRPPPTARRSFISDKSDRFGLFPGRLPALACAMAAGWVDN
jgi:hypothetical protein